MEAVLKAIAEPRRREILRLVSGDELTAERVETDQVGVERADTGSERIDLALHLAAHDAQVETLARSGSKRVAVRHSSMNTSWVTSSDIAGSRNTRFTVPNTTPASSS